MNRRNVIKSGLAVAGAIISSRLIGSSRKAPKQMQTGMRSLRLDIGTLETYIISDGFVELEHIHPVFAPDENPVLVKQELEKLHLKDQPGQASINILLIRSNGKLILLDTGSGIYLGPNSGKLLEGLESLGIEPVDITDIIISHAHLDHIGGILDGNGNLVFPSAAYHIAAKEHEFWMAKEPSFSRSKGQSDQSFSISLAKKIFTKIASKLHLFQYGDTLFGCMKTELAEGHTPGHTIFTIYAGNKAIKHIVDTFHTPLLIAQPGWGTQWDTDFYKAVETRELIIKRAIEQNTVIMSCHLPWPGLGYIDRVDNQAYWTIYPYFEPNRIII
ncbi:MBL fold metallo-hydrolase [Sphingobacterium paludis]|uniref:Metallo-beta-lactamase superfamily protein n=1 Tax=Sphingobacterium paludis TaxID=1476465 RepID=A0A4R7CUX7_9SPHI|nr:MBL fold metallo-hydrolase [Sphingobacterium paludis]TDS12189.1 metallo-beta-lactamase superfamily protein [Sphingobacterium paludis]